MKKVLCICMSVAFVALMGSCNKECVCKKSVSNVVAADTTAVDTTVTATPNVDENMLHAGMIYDKRECEYLNVSDTTTTQIVSLECTMEKK